MKKMKCPINQLHKTDKVFETEHFVFLRCSRTHKHLEAPNYSRFTRSGFRKDIVFMVEKEGSN